MDLLFATNYLVYVVKANFKFYSLLFLILKWVWLVFSIKCKDDKILYLENEWFSLYESIYSWNLLLKELWNDMLYDAESELCQKLLTRNAFPGTQSHLGN